MPSSSHSVSHDNPYAPAPLTLLRYLATTIFTTHALHHVLSRKAARERSQVPPDFGLAEGLEGVVQGLGANGPEGCVVEMEHRRKSGRGVREWYFLPSVSASSKAGAGAGGRYEVGGRKREVVILLEDHAAYRGPEEKEGEVSALPRSCAKTSLEMILIICTARSKIRKLDLLPRTFRSTAARQGRRRPALLRRPERRRRRGPDPVRYGKRGRF